MDDAVSCVRLSLQIGDVDRVASARNHVLIAKRDDVWRVMHLLVGEYGRAREEGGNCGVGNRRDRPIQRRTAQTGVEARGAALLEPNNRPTIFPERQCKRVTGIDQVRVGDLGVDIPDLRP